MRNPKQLSLPPSTRAGTVQRIRHRRKLDDILRNNTPVTTLFRAKPCGKYHKRRKDTTPSEATFVNARKYARTLSHLEHKELPSYG